MDGYFPDSPHMVTYGTLIASDPRGYQPFVQLWRRKLSTRARIFQTGLKETHSFFQILSQAMWLGFTV